MKRTLLLLVSLAITFSVWADGLVYTPTLKSPADSAIYQVPNVTVSWNAITGSLTLQYELQMDTTPLFNSALRVDTTQTLITGYTAHELLFGKVYYWRVRAIDLGQTSGWSAVRQFTVFNKPVLSTPTNGQPGQVPNVSIVWKNTVTTGDGAATLTGYRYWDYQLAADSNFTTPLFQGSTIPTVLKFTTSNLSFGGIYYWRVRARHNLSTSGWSSTFKFTVANTIALTSPTDNGANQMLDVLLKWTNITGLVGYQIEMASDAAFSNILLSNDVDTSFYRTSSLMFNTKYYWRVRGRHMYDSTGWSNPRSFTTIATVALKTPSDAATDIALKPTFQWNAITTIVGYQLQVDSINTFPTPTIDVRPSYKDATYTSTKKLRPLTTYYWRMRAFSDGGVTADTTEWCTPRSFITNSSTGIDENFSTAVGIYPNPASEKVFVRIEMTESLTAQLTLVDLLGKIVISRELNLTSGHNIKEIPLDNLNKGIYILRLTMNGHTTNQKLIVEK
jgi:hypothetical protein